MAETKKTTNNTSGKKSGTSTTKKTSSTSKSATGAKKTTATKKTTSSKQGAKKTTEFEEYRKSGSRRKSDFDVQDFESFRKSEKRREEEYEASLKKNKVRDEVYIIGALLAAILMILSYFNVCGIIGKAINTLLFGFMGAFAYVFPFAFFIMVTFLVINKKNTVARRKITFCIIAIICVSSIIHIATRYDDVNLFQAFSVGFKEKAGGGFFGHLLAWPLCALFGKIAAIIIEVTLLIVCFMMLTGTAIISLIKQKSKAEYDEISRKRKLNEEKRQRVQYERTIQKMAGSSGRSYGNENYERDSSRPKIYAADAYNAANAQSSSGTYVPKKTRESFFDKLKNGSKSEGGLKKSTSENSGKNVDLSAEKNAKQDHNLDMVEITGASDMPAAEESVYMQEMARKFGNKAAQEEKYENIINDREEEYEPVIVGADNRTESAELPSKNDFSVKDNMGNFGMTKNETGNVEKSKSSHAGVFARGDYRPQGTPEVQSHSLAGKQETSTASPADDASNVKIVKKVPKVAKPYIFPPLSKLTKGSDGGKGTTAAELKETAKKLQDTLASFGVNVTITNISCGPSVTRYELQPEQGVKVSKITSLADDIKLNLAAADIRIEAPIPGKAAVGIEVPNKVNQTVYLSSLISSSEFTNSKSNLTFAVGKDLGGQVIVHDIKKMPHLLVAGATGSGKSVCINTLIMSLIYKASPEDVRLILIDPKVVELSIYNGIPHLLIPVVTDPKKASAALNWAVMEMTDRYKKFADLGVRDLEGYNKRVANQKEPEQSSSGEIYEKLPQIVIIIDELADLMMVAPGEVEDYICRLAQLARACGIHLVIATQRPSVNVITGLIKANVPSRIAFAVASQVDSRTIIDMGGAEKLLGKGDMLFYPTGYPKPVRVQGAFVSDAEVSAVVDFVKSHNDDNYNSEIESKMSEAAAAQTSGGKGSNSAGAQDSGSNHDEYLYMAGSFIIQKEKASIGGLQRQFKIGFNRAARIMDQLCEMGVVGPEEGTKPRQILMTLEAFEQFASSNGLK
ncbi:MAG: DNA translocase FtsK 4TM domain-containing protein [Lachnospiraceae bacterium]|nr:DNA translocase FtsK 4TM domain-containing protein [Lachnospiraceae bacterium]